MSKIVQDNAVAEYTIRCTAPEMTKLALCGQSHDDSCTEHHYDPAALDCWNVGVSLYMMTYECECAGDYQAYQCLYIN